MTYNAEQITYMLAEAIDGNNMNLREEIIKLIMESYDKGVEDTKQEAIIALEKTVAMMVAAEREACAKLVDHILKEGGGTYADAIRARGQA